MGPMRSRSLNGSVIAELILLNRKVNVVPPIKATGISRDSILTHSMSDNYRFFSKESFL